MIAKLAPVADVLKEWTPTPSGIANHFQTLLDDPKFSDGNVTNLRTNVDGRLESFQLAPIPADFLSLNVFAIGVAYRGQTGADPGDTTLLFVQLTINGVSKSEVQAPAYADPTVYQYREVTSSDWIVRKGDLVRVQFRANLVPLGVPSVNLQQRLSAMRGVLNYNVNPWIPIANPTTLWSKV